MQRDMRKSESYFSGLINYQEGSVREIQGEIEANEYTTEGNLSASSSIFDKRLHRLVMRYSRGDELGDFATDLLSLLTARRQFQNFADVLPADLQEVRVMYERLSEDVYPGYLWWLAFAVSIGMDREYIRQALALIGNAGQDELLDRIAVALGDTGRALGSGVRYKQYAPLLDALHGSEAKQAAAVKKFLDGWYKGSKSVYWHGNDKDDNSGYMGYWAFEAALVVILFDIDDSGFRDHPYYPKDLVAHARAQRAPASTGPSTPPPLPPTRAAAGAPCPQAGYWFTPAQADSRRYFAQGELFPEIAASAYGATFWQWSPQQTPAADK